MEVTLDWLGTATFRLRIGKLVVFLDAYLDRIPTAPDIGLTAADIDEAHFCLIGHSHFDHLWGAHTIARNTGATVIGSLDARRIMLGEGVPMSQTMAVAGGEKIKLDKDIDLYVYPSLHSAGWTTGIYTPSDKVHIGDIGCYEHEKFDPSRPGRPNTAIEGPGAEIAAQHMAERHAGDYKTEGGFTSMAYVIVTPVGSIFYKDTCGHWTGVLRDTRKCDVVITGAAARGNQDGIPHQGSIASWVAREADIMRPKTLILNHHDDWIPPITKPFDYEPVEEAVARAAPFTNLLKVGYNDHTRIL